MSVATQLVFFIGAFAASAAGVGFFRQWSHRRKLFDVPNERSSHSTPTPRGGGLVIALVCLSFYVVIGVVTGLPFSWGYFCGALLVATVSWIDDLYSLPFWSRLLVHILAASILLWDVGFWSDISIPATSVQILLGTVVGSLVTIGWIAWLVNAYNFMDGIDGIAALQATLAGIGWAVLACFLKLESTYLLSGIVAASSAGFLLHNWQPARIFMGDVGSAFLGFTLAAIPLVARAEAQSDIPILPAVAVLFVWFFVFDTIFTLVRRLIGRKKVWQAHREHIYQKLIIEGWRHAPVAVIYNSSAAVLIVLVLLSVRFSGIYPLLTLLSVTGLTAAAAYVGLRKKTLT
jgi:Fuc2NAc and GlcNAc transferase